MAAGTKISVLLKPFILVRALCLLLCRLSCAIPHFSDGCRQPLLLPTLLSLCYSHDFTDASPLSTERLWALAQAVGCGVCYTVTRKYNWIHISSLHLLKVSHQCVSFGTAYPTSHFLRRCLEQHVRDRTFLPRAGSRARPFCVMKQSQHFLSLRATCTGPWPTSDHGLQLPPQCSKVPMGLFQKWPSLRPINASKNSGVWLLTLTF